MCVKWFCFNKQLYLPCITSNSIILCLCVCVCYSYPVSCFRHCNLDFSRSREASSRMTVWHMRVLWSTARCSSRASSAFSASRTFVRSASFEISSWLSVLVLLNVLFLQKFQIFFFLGYKSYKGCVQLKISLNLFN